MLDNGAMDRAINTGIERGYVVKVVDEIEGQPNQAYKRYHIMEGNAVQFFSVEP